MKIKSYFAATVEAAMSMARLELGPDAMLVNTRRTGPETRHLGEYEVVVAAAARHENSGATSGVGSSGAQNQAHKGTGQPIDRLSEDVAALKHEMERLASALTRSTAGIAKIAANGELADAFSMLLAAELDAEIAQEVLSRVSGHLEDSAKAAAGAANLMISELSRLVNVDSRLASTPEKNTIALVGPPGAGKTTTLVKLAVLYGLATRRPSQILSLDTHRVAATEPLRSYAAITGLAFRALPPPRSLWQALEECRSKELIFIDTPGLSSADFEEAADIAKPISRHPKIETYLVLNAAMKPADLKRTAERYEMFGPAKLIFTHLDETETFGPLLNLSIRTGKPISFLTRGQQIPEDLEPASPRRIVDLVMRDAPRVRQEMTSTAAA